jgi:hypothetical protein
MALCRFKLPDKDYEEFKKVCESQKLKISDVLRSMVGEYLGHEIKVRVYGELNRGHDCGHNMDNELNRGHDCGHNIEDKTNRGHDCGHELDDELNRGHNIDTNRGHNIEDNEIVATNSKYPIFNDDGTIKEWIYE